MVPEDDLGEQIRFSAVFWQEGCDEMQETQRTACNGLAAA